MIGPALRKSVPSRIAAVGFILVILFGNLWLARAIVGASAEVIIGVGFALGIALALGGGAGMGVLAVKRRLYPEPPEDTVPPLG